MLRVYIVYWFIMKQRGLRHTIPGLRIFQDSLPNSTAGNNVYARLMRRFSVREQQNATHLSLQGQNGKKKITQLVERLAIVHEHYKIHSKHLKTESILGVVTALDAAIVNYYSVPFAKVSLVATATIILIMIVEMYTVLNQVDLHERIKSILQRVDPQALQDQTLNQEVIEKMDSLLTLLRKNGF